MRIWSPVGPSVRRCHGSRLLLQSASFFSLEEHGHQPHNIGKHQHILVDMKRSLILSLLSIGSFLNESRAFSTSSLSLRGIGAEDFFTRRRNSSTSSSENNSHDGGLGTVEAKRVDELKTMSRQDLKLERLKLHSQKAKFESKVAKGRLKLYSASRALVMTTT